MLLLSVICIKLIKIGAYQYRAEIGIRTLKIWVLVGGGGKKK
jgi:hypothetical protein